MAIHVSPGVYVTITDLSQYTQLVPSTNSLFIFFSDKGQDNVLLYKANEDELLNEYGEPNLRKYTQSYGQGLMICDNFVKVGGGAYCMRVLPDDASYSNLMLYIDTGSNTIKLAPQSGITSDVDEILQSTYDKIPVVIFYANGRGKYYNDISVKLTPVVNQPDVYVLDVYQTTSTGTHNIESLYVSFDQDKVDDSGESYYIEHVVNQYSKYIKCGVNTTNIQSLKDLSTYTVIDVVNDPPATPADGDTYLVGTSPTGDFIDHTNDIATYSATTTSWTFTTPDIGSVVTVTSSGKKLYFTGLLWIDYDPFASEFSQSTPDDTDYKEFGEGSDGSLFDADGNIDPNVANDLLAKAFLGQISDDVVNTTNLYFGLAWDGGYPDPVKDAIVQLASEIRKDCVALLDNGDQPSMDDEITARNTDHLYDTYYAAIYTTYTMVYDEFSGTYVWVSPLYHLAKVIGAETYPWFAPAGETRATLSGIHDIRYNIPNVNWRDQFTINQLNPIIKFSWGYTIWGDKTSQRVASKMQDLPVVRLVLYTSHALQNYCNSYVLDSQNDAITWDSIRSEISLFLSRLKTLRALESYNIEVGASDYELKTETCHVNVTLTPITPLSIINLNFFIK